MKRTIAALAPILIVSVFGLRARGDDYSLAVIHRTRIEWPRYLPGELIVQFRSGADDRDAERAIREVGGAGARRSAYGPRYLVTMDAGLTVDDALTRLGSMPEVEYAEANGVLHTMQSRVGFFTPNDPRYSLQWNMRLLNAERVWGIQKGDPSVGVAVIDTGIAFEDFGRFRKSPDFTGTTFLTGFNVFTRDSHANDDNWHGTHVASTIAEATDNGIAVAGLAFQCALMPVKVLNSAGSGGFFGVAEGIDYVTNFRQGGTNPVKVINLSLGGDISSTAVSQAIDRAVAAGITVVAAAGNDGVGTITFPAALPNVIAVGAVDGRKERTSYSNFGPELDLMAPGGDLDRDDDRDGQPDGVVQLTLHPSLAEAGRFDTFVLVFADGTSQATPHVAASAALLYRQGITKPDAIKASLEGTAEDLGAPGRDDRYGNGLVRPAEALKGLGLNK
ncbi:MAG TPA: S8 family serine peptidase [Vicinamibacteria bacterium]